MLLCILGAAFAQEPGAALERSNGEIWYLYDDGVAVGDPGNEHQAYDQALGWTPPQAVDAAFRTAFGKSYLFFGDQYVLLDDAGGIKDGYPKSISDGWPTLAWSRDLDAAIGLSDGFAYFFEGSEYVKYNTVEDRQVDGYPKPIEGNWGDLPGGAVTWGAATAPKKLVFGVGGRRISYDLAADRVEGSTAAGGQSDGIACQIDPDSGSEVMAFAAGASSSTDTVILPAGPSKAAGEYSTGDLEAYTEGSSISVTNWRGSAPGIKFFPPGSKHSAMGGCRKVTPNLIVAHETSVAVDHVGGRPIHFFIDSKGSIFQIAPVDTVIVHAEEVNGRSIGIEVASQGCSASTSFTKLQIPAGRDGGWRGCTGPVVEVPNWKQNVSLYALVSVLSEHFGIPAQVRQATWVPGTFFFLGQQRDPGTKWKQATDHDFAPAVKPDDARMIVGLMSHGVIWGGGSGDHADGGFSALYTYYRQTLAKAKPEEKTKSSPIAECMTEYVASSPRLATTDVRFQSYSFPSATSDSMTVFELPEFCDVAKCRVAYELFTHTRCSVRAGIEESTPTEGSEDSPTEE